MVKPAGGSATDAGYGIAVDASGNSYLTGEFEGSTTFGANEVNETTLNSNGSTDIFVAKYNSEGLLLWVKPAGSSDDDQARFTIFALYWLAYFPLLIVAVIVINSAMGSLSTRRHLWMKDLICHQKLNKRLVHTYDSYF